MPHFAVIGNPAHHSKSPLIHQLFAEQTGIALTYTTLEVENADFKQTVLNFPGQGLNVTQPYKQQACHLVDKLSDRAQRAQAINTIKYNVDGSRYGDNTDGAGLIKDLTINKQLILKDKQILILGAGGAARGIIQSLLNESPANLIIANRTYAKAVALAHQFNEPIACPLADLANHPVDLVINAANLTAVPPINLIAKSCCYDLSYGQATPFLQWAKQQGINHWDGIGMLVEQAAAAFFVWHNIYPDTKRALQILAN
ncbi:MAG: shikimate dehydrogenase [Pseudomonadota bacterium]